MKKEECPICEQEYEETGDQGEEVTSCPRCGTDFNGSEKKRMGAHGTYSTKEKPNLGSNAYISLTDRRLVVVPEKLEGYGLAMALTAAITNKLRSKYTMVSIPLDQIKEAREVKVGLLGREVIVDTKDGDFVKFRVSKQKVWVETINDVIAALK